MSECTCSYHCPTCGRTGSGPEMKDDPHWGDLDVHDHAEFIAICINNCGANSEPGEQQECSASDCVCYALTQRACPHCEGPVHFEPVEVAK